MKKFLSYTLLVAFVFSCSNSNIISDFSYLFKASSWLKKSTPVSEEYLDTIPIKLLFGQPIGEVVIAGNKRDFLFDTGAHTVIDEHDVDREGIKTFPEPDYDVRDTSDGFYKFIRKNKMFKSEFLNIIDTLTINKTSFKKVGAATMLFKISHYISECFDNLGILGNNVMNDGVWSFDYKNKRIVFSNTIENFELKNAVVFDADFKFGFPIINFPIKDTVVRAGIDTGNNSLAISMNDGLLRSYSIKTAYEVTANLSHFNIYSSLQKGFESKNVEYLQLQTDIFGFPYRFNAITDMDVGLGENINSRFDLMMGYEFIKDFVVTIDYINEKVYFQPNESSKEMKRPIETASINIGLSKYDNRAYITSFLPDKIDTSNVDISDTLIAVNNVPIDSIITQDNYCDFIRERDNLKQSDLDTTIFTIKNKNGETHDFKSYRVTLFDD